MSKLSEMTYKGPIKEKSRELFWRHAVESLTSQRRNNRILNKEYLRRLWEYSFFKCLPGEDHNDYILNDWLAFSDLSYGEKTPEQLKIVFLCGPEPENDVKVLLRLGVRIENIFAIEKDKDTFKKAIDSLAKTYPTLKIFKGGIESFVAAYPIKFDIIYLDYTASLLAKVVDASFAKVIFADSLEDLSVLAINTCCPSFDDPNIDIFIKTISNYLFYQECIEYATLHDEENDGRFIESPCDNYEEVVFQELIRENLGNAYSTYQTSFISNILCIIKPFNSVINTPELRKRLFSDNEKIRDIMKEFSRNEDTYMDPAMYPLYHPFSAETGTYREIKSNGEEFSIQEITSLIYPFLDASYNDNKEFLSNSVNSVLPEFENNFIGYQKGRFNAFCDVPTPSLLLELAIYQLGHPYHINMNNHKRWSYTDKTRTMYMDIFTVDKCRALYDWLPMIEYYPNNLHNKERQIITRMCIDAIKKHLHYFIPRQFYGSALIGINEEEWSTNYEIPTRGRLKREEDSPDSEE